MSFRFRTVGARAPSTETPLVSVVAPPVPTTDGKLHLAYELNVDNALDQLSDGKPAPTQPGFTPREESDKSPLALDVMSHAGG